MSSARFVSLSIGPVRYFDGFWSNMLMAYSPCRCASASRRARCVCWGCLHCISAALVICWANPPQLRPGTACVHRADPVSDTLSIETSLQVATYGQLAEVLDSSARAVGQVLSSKLVSTFAALAAQPVT